MTSNDGAVSLESASPTREEWVKMIQVACTKAVNQTGCGGQHKGCNRCNDMRRTDAVIEQCVKRVKCLQEKNLRSN